MKFAFRTPSPKRKLKAMTVGRAKRTVKRAIDPTYGKKGMGWVKNPKKAAYNKIYNKTTMGAGDLLSKSKGSGSQRTSPPVSQTAPEDNTVGCVWVIIGIMAALAFAFMVFVFRCCSGGFS